MSDDLDHGGALDRMRTAFPDATEPWIDLSTGINPWSYPYTETLNQALTRLPTKKAVETCQAAMIEALNIQGEAVTLSPGSELLIRLLPDVIRPHTIAILHPTYGDHAAVWHRSGARIIQTDDPLAMADQVEAVIVCNPNNPDGRLFSIDALKAARQKLAARGGWLIVDEAYADLNPACSLAPDGGMDGLIVLRSFGKFFGLAGLRLGALIAPLNIHIAMTERLGVWPVSGAALEIGARAYADAVWQVQMRATLAAASARLDTLLSIYGAKTGELKIVGGTDLFRFISVANSHAVFEALARCGIYVRRFNWSARHLRIGLPATPEAEMRLQTCLNNITG